MTLGAMNYIRSRYGVPADFGRRILYTYRGRRGGVIIGADGAHLKIRLDGEKRWERYHPTWELEYLDEIDPVAERRARQSIQATLAPHCQNCGAFTDRDWHETQVCRSGKGCQRAAVPL